MLLPASGLKLILPVPSKSCRVQAASALRSELWGLASAEAGGRGPSPFSLPLCSAAGAFPNLQEMKYGGAVAVATTQHLLMA